MATEGPTEDSAEDTPPTRGEPGPVRRRVAALAQGAWVAALVLALGLTVAGVVLPEGESEARSYVAPDPAQPIRLRIPSLDVTAPVVPIGMLAGRVLQPPADYTKVGWWDVSARAGARRGQTVVTGHTVHTGGGALNRVTALGRGERVLVVSREGTVRYRVSAVRVLSRAELAEQAEALFGQDHGRGRLVLVSCTDWNGSTFENNVVVLARRV
ncbi:class F sortase [Nocardioides sp. SOB77]|uniref:Class F sortase n=1 Tax=Nocardioides oceani TaxID=3058369 RepID=A0ABT8FDS3_9ACTN|nr:class F sortase [Nocardioides oceani]MDN4172562.1 class F sortase [Nocardioides oceani]